MFQTNFQPQPVQNCQICIMHDLCSHPSDRPAPLSLHHRASLQVSCAAAVVCLLTVTCLAPRLSRPVTPQSPAPWTATLTTQAWPTWEARPLSSTAPQPTRLMLVSVHTYCTCTDDKHNGVHVCILKHTHTQNVSGHKVKVSDLLCGDFPMGLSVSVSSKTITNSPPIALFCPPSISSLLPSLPFIWQPQLFPVCWLIASLFHLAESKRERERRRIEKNGYKEKDVRYCLLKFFSVMMMMQVDVDSDSDWGRVE